MHQYNLRHIKFKGKTVFLDNNPRIGFCSKCGKGVGEPGVRRTNMHHDEYDDKDVLANTRELCDSCHTHEHKGYAMSDEECRTMKREWIQNWRNNNREESRRKDREYYHKNRLKILAKKKERRIQLCQP